MKRCRIAFVVLCVAALWSGTIAAAADAPLADAAERQDKTAIKALLEAKAASNAPQADGMTALHWAAYHDDEPAVELLLKAGANAKAENRYGVTPLSLAAVNGNGQIVERLLKAGADPNRALRGGETPLMTAARTGKLAAVQTLVDHGADVNAKELKGQTPLMWAAAEGHADVVQALLSAGADFRTPLATGFTPLLFAVREGKTDVVRVLLAAGADFNEAMQPTRRAPQRAAASGNTPLTIAVENGHFDLATLLLQAGADPNDLRSGYAPLHMLTWVRKPNRGDGENGDPAPAGSGTMTSLQFARELVRHGADLDLRLKRGGGGHSPVARGGATPFLMACVTADVPLMKLLVELGADARLPNSEGTTPLMAAAGVGCRAPGEEAGTEAEALEAVALTLKHGNDIDAVDQNGETAMHGAAYKSFPQVVRLLANRGADISVWNRPNKHGWTPLAIAEGYRFGNFKPAPDVMAALHEVMLAAGVTPPASSKPTPERKGYSP
jgi:ankyrin repeat protein